MNKSRNYYFVLRNNKTNEVYAYLHERISDVVFHRIKDEYFANDYIWNEFYKNPRSFMMDKGLKKYINKIYPCINHKFSDLLGKNIMLNDDVDVHFISVYDYRNFDEEFDNECKFVEYIINEKKNEDKLTEITPLLLNEVGFTQCNDAPWLKEKDNPFPTYYQYYTDKEDGYIDFIKLDLTEGNTNNGERWNVHIDNSDCCTIGSADISTVYQFNLLMEVFGSKFRL